MRKPRRPPPGSTLKAGGLQVLAFPLALALGVLDPCAVASGASGDIIETIPLDPPGSCGLAFDEVEGVYYVSNVLEHFIQVFSPESFESPLRTIVPPGGDVRGIAWDSLDQTLWVADSLMHQIVELDAAGGTLRTIAVPRPDVPVDPEDPAGGNYSLVGLAFDPAGDEGKGSLFLTVHAWRLGMLYEMALDGRLLRAFSDPIDPEHVPGTPGASISLSGGIHLIHEGGLLAGIQVAGTVDGGRAEAILDLDPDGRFTGTSYPLENVGGIVTAFLRRPFPDPRSGKEVEAFICVSNRPWITVLDAAPPVVLELSDLRCSESGTEAVISWTCPQKYDFIEVRAGGETAATLPGDAASWQGVIPPGLHEVTVHAFVALNESRLGPCTVVLGYGQILHSVDLDIATDYTLPAEIAWDGESTIIVFDPVSGKIIRFDLSLRLLGTAALSGKYAGDIISGIAGADEPGTIFVFNESRKSIGKITFSGELVREFPFALPDALAGIHNMTFFRGRGAGDERLWIEEEESGELCELDLDGVLLRQMAHPYSSIDGADGKCMRATTCGISADAGSESPELLLWGQTASLRWPEAVFRFDPADRRIVGGCEMPTGTLERKGWYVWPAFEHVMTPSGPRIYLLSRFDARLYELDAQPRTLRPPSFLACAQIDRQGRIELEFGNNGPYDRIEITRDRSLIATVDGAGTRHIDEGAPPGLHEYAVRGVTGNVTSDFARCEVRSGVGAVLAREPGCSLDYPVQITRDPTDGFFFVLDRAVGPSAFAEIHLYDRDLQFIEIMGIEEVSLPMEINTLALRIGPGGDRILYYLVRENNVDRDSRIFLVEHFLGERPSLWVEVVPPRHPKMFIMPVGLTWDPETDTFYYQEKNCDTFVQMDPDGNTLRVFPNPSPPASFMVYDGGLALHLGRRTLFFTSADPGDLSVTKALEMTLDGALTGLEVPMVSGPSVSDAVHGVVFAGGDLVGVGPLVEGPAFLRLMVFPEETSAADFRRGDSNGDGKLNITDPIQVLAYLFQGGTRPACFDAADADDNGALEITDAVRVLGFLFLGGGTIPAPGPDACGPDPTPDKEGADFGCAYLPGACPHPE